MVMAFLISISLIRAEPYREFIEHEVYRQFNSFDRVSLIAGICDTESRFKPNARSPTGARGLCQLTGIAMRQICILNPLLCSIRPFDAKQNLKGGITLFKHYWYDYWSHKSLSQCDQLRLTVDSYNAGPNHVGRAFKRGGIDGYREHVKLETFNYSPQVLKREYQYIKSGWKGALSCYDKFLS